VRGPGSEENMKSDFFASPCKGFFLNSNYSQM
jgi:hypothetical protein